MYFRFDEFDEAIDEAIEDDIKEADGGGMFVIFSSLSNLANTLTEMPLFEQRASVFSYSPQHVS